MSEKSINEQLFDDAKVAAERLCFDISVDKAVCLRQAKRLVVEIAKMIRALENKQ